MNSYFEIDEKEMQEIFFNRYKTDPNYNKNLDINYNLKISKRESIEGTEKTIKLKIDKRRKDKSVKIKIPKGIKDNQSIVLIGEGRKENNKYGNLTITVKVK